MLWANRPSAPALCFAQDAREAATAVSRLSEASQQAMLSMIDHLRGVENGERP